VEIGLIDFQGRWEGWETALSFSTLSTDRHFPPSASVATFVMRRYHRRSNGNSSGNVKIWVSFGPEVPSAVTAEVAGSSPVVPAIHSK